MATIKSDIDALYSKLPEETRVLANAVHVFSESLLTYNRTLESVDETSKTIKGYFSDAKGGFQEDLSNLQKAQLETFTENNEKLVKALQDSCAKYLETQTKIHNENLAKVENNLEKKILEGSKSVTNRVLLILASSSALIGIIFFFVERSIISSSTEAIVKEVLKSLVK